MHCSSVSQVSRPADASARGLPPGVAPRHPRPVGHSAHFLERLDRVPRSLSDFALGLYRDEARVKLIVESAHLPANETRVALALGPDGDGPYVVVTREGKFVTALGAQMTPKNLPILSRGQVDTFSARVDATRARLALAKEIVPPGMEAADIVGLLSARAHSLTREEFSAMAAWAPRLATEFFYQSFADLEDVELSRATFLTCRDKQYRSDPETKRGLDRIWNMTHAMGARLALAAMSDLAWVEQVADGWHPHCGPTAAATSERVHSVAMRGAWAAARMGKHFLPVYKRILATPCHLDIRFDAALAMTAIGLRHARYRDDARRALEGMVNSASPAGRDWEELVVAASARAFDDPDGALAEVAEHGADVLASHSASFPEGSPYRFANPEDVPRETALLVAANQMHESISPQAFYSLPWVAKLGSAEELYYPEDLAQGLRVAWTPELIEIIYSRKRPPPPQPETRSVPKIGRNEPCSCGSGTKHKKCCGR